MRLVSFRRGSRDSWGIAKDDGVIDAAPRFGTRFATLRDAIAGNAMPELRQMAATVKPELKLADVTYLPVIPNPDKIICVGVNYEEHRKETGRDPSQHSVLFTRFANTQVGHNSPMVKPKVSDKFDFEGELAVIIGRKARHVAEADALTCVAGYACYNDGSVRDWQNHTHQFTPGKNFVGTGAFGPWMVTADEIPDPSKLTLTTRLNGQVVQQSGTDMMIFDIPYLIRYISTFTELVPGDVISTGTPGGVGAKRTPPLWMRPGDTVEVEISGIGVLRNPIVAE